MLEGLLADDMLHPASVLFRRFTVNTGSDELLCKESMAFIDFFRHFLAYVGQGEKSILVHRQKTTVPQDAYCMTDTRF